MTGRNALTHETEITSAVDECLPNGQLNRDAIGFSRRPLHRCNLSGAPGRKKRWDFWGITSDESALAITYADLDYLGLVVVEFLDFATGEMTQRAAVLPFAAGFSQPETVAGADIVFRRRGLLLEIREQPGRTQIVVSFNHRRGPVRGVFDISRPAAHETLNVLVPWSEDRYQFTSKQNTLPTTGELTVGTRRYVFGPDNGSFATLDYGRGVWPYSTLWNWGTASGRSGGHVIGLQFGDKWTDGTGSTENGIVIDGRLSKIGEALEWTYDTDDFSRPWRIRSRDSDCVDVTLTPFHVRSVGVPTFMPAGAKLNHAYGHFSGQVRDEQGRRYEFDGLVGWAEEMWARW